MNRIFIYFTLFYSVSVGQIYDWPTDAPRSLKSNFGEFRDRHFHMGIDIKTGGQEGAEVYAVASGYVSRMVANFNGYGKALYIAHPNGKATVYAHLSNFNPKLEGYLQHFQNKNASYILDHYFEPNEVTVEKGEFLGRTGNTGNSYGPHLHFEIRNQKEQPLNPQTYGFTVDDRRSPVLEQLAIIPLKQESTANGSRLPVHTPFYANSDGTFDLADTLNIFGPIGLTVKVADERQGFSEKYQIKKLELIVDGRTEYKLLFDRLDYTESDRVQLIRNNELERLNLGTFHNLYSLDGYPRSIIQPKKKSGILKLPPGYHSLVIEATDANGNSTTGRGVIVNQPPIDLIIQEIEETPRSLIFNIQSKTISIPLASLTCYSFSSSGLADEKVSPSSIVKEKGGLIVAVDKRMIRDRSLQFIAKNKMGTYSTPLHWHPDNIPIDYNSKPDIRIRQSSSGIFIQVETGEMGPGLPKVSLDLQKTHFPVKMKQIQPYTYLSTPLDIKIFKNIQSIHVTINNGTETTYKFAFDPALTGQDDAGVVLSQDKMCSLKIPSSSTYSDGLVWVDVVENAVPPPHGKHLSKVYQLQPFTVPLQEKVDIGIRYDSSFLGMDKISLYYYDQDEGWTFIQSNNSVKRQVLTGSIKSLEAVCILQDLVPPVIRSTFPADGGEYYLQDVKTLTATVNDDLSGIEPEESAITMTLDGKRTICAYQPIDKKISYNLNQHLSKGDHTMSIWLKDRSGNEASHVVNFKIK